MAGSGGADTPRKSYKKMWVETAEGSTLAQSRKSPGGNAPFALNDKGIQEQVVLHNKKPKTSGGDGALAEFLTPIIIAVAVAGAQEFNDKGVPAIQRWFADRQAWKLAAKSAATPSTEVASAERDSEAPAGNEVAEIGTEIEAQQWYRLFYDAIAHGAAGRAHLAISAEAWQALASAHVTDPETQALAGAMRELTPEQISGGVNRVLEEHPDLRDEDPMVILRRLFGDHPDESLIAIPADQRDESEAPRMLDGEQQDARDEDDADDGPTR